MIADTLVHLTAQADTLDPRLARGLEFLRNTDFSDKAAGRHEVDADLFYFINEYETKAAEECFWEAHRVYLDIHYLLSGGESIGYAPIERLELKEAYSAERDAVFFTGPLQSAVAVQPGDVVVCYPQDGHMTGIMSSSKEAVRKVVLKIRL